MPVHKSITQCMQRRRTGRCRCRCMHNLQTLMRFLSGCKPVPGIQMKVQIWNTCAGQGLLLYHSVLYMLVFALQPLSTFTRSSRKPKHLHCRPRSMSAALGPPSSGSFLQLPAQAQLVLVKTAEQLLTTRLTRSQMPEQC